MATGLAWGTDGDFNVGGLLTVGNAECDMFFDMSFTNLAAAAVKVPTEGPTNALGADSSPRSHADPETTGNGHSASSADKLRHHLAPAQLH